jgi:hypothetical protein
MESGKLSIWLSVVPQELAEQPLFALGASFNTGNCICLTSLKMALQDNKAQVMPSSHYFSLLILKEIMPVTRFCCKPNKQANQGL